MSEELSKVNSETSVVDCEVSISTAVRHVMKHVEQLLGFKKFHRWLFLKRDKVSKLKTGMEK